MHLDTSTYYSAMCHGLRSPSLLSDSDDLAFLSFDSPTSPDTPSGKAIFPPTTSPTVYDLWLASREVPAKTGGYFVPGNQRPLNLANARLAYALSHQCVWKLFKALWELKPVCASCMIALQIVRSLFPAFRGYSHALIIDEIQSLIASGSFTWSYLLFLLISEVGRRVAENLLEKLIAKNENVVRESAQSYVERRVLELRLQLDIPALEDANIRDLLRESDSFASSFHGAGFGYLSPLDFVRLISHLTEIASQVYLVYSLTTDLAHFCVFAISAFYALLPYFTSRYGPFYPQQSDMEYTATQAAAAERKERMRGLVYNHSYRPEIALFGLEKWIVGSWFKSSQELLGTCDNEIIWWDIFGFLQINPSEVNTALQYLSLIIFPTAASLGSITVYRNSIYSMVSSIQLLVSQVRMAFQAIFMMSAFCASMELKPRMQPKEKETIMYEPQPNGGMSITVEDLSYFYPGSNEPALRNINFSLQQGETLAIVGCNGSGKSTLAKVLLRLIEFNSGSIHINKVDIRNLDPMDYHKRLTTVFQGFSKFNTTVAENVGLGDVRKMVDKDEIRKAIHLAEADGIVSGLAGGMDTILEIPGFEALSYPGSPCESVYDGGCGYGSSVGGMDDGLSGQSVQHRSGLSGGEWQRIAIARAFMRATEPDVDLLLFDEPTSSLDAHAQKQIFDTIKQISRPASGVRKNVIFITHRLSIARRADKIAMMENGTITEFGTHESLLKNNGPYAALYNASL